MANIRRSPDWICSAAPDLVIDRESGWDYTAASERMMKAGPAIARRGHLFHDASKPHGRDAYRMPFADVAADGKHLFATTPGIRDAMSRLAGENFMDREQKQEARSVIDRYYSATTVVPAVIAVKPTPPRSAPAAPPPAPVAAVRSPPVPRPAPVVTPSMEFDAGAAAARAALFGNAGVTSADRAAHDTAAATARDLRATGHPNRSEYESGAAAAATLLGKPIPAQPARA